MPTDAMEPELPRNFMRHCILLLLREDPGHGYDLLQRLAPLGCSADDPGRLYRTLRALESECLVASSWESSANGPDRRVYHLTRAGKEELHRRARALQATRALLDRFVTRYGEFVALTERERAPVGER